MKKIWKPVFAPVTAMNVLTHPDYDEYFENWEKYRFTFEGGHDFVEEYLKQFSTKENPTDFANRMQITYCPAHAKAVILEIKNAIYQRLVDVKRLNGPGNYNSAVNGENGGVDFHGNSMNSFIGRLILPELLSMAKVGVFIDKDPVESVISKSKAKEKRPYLYMYTAEAIRSWTINKQGQLTALLLQDDNMEIDELTGLVSTSIKEFRHLKLTDNGVVVEFYDANGKAIGDKNTVLELTQIPFVMFELTHSLLIDVADYQIAMLQLASSDIHYAWKANYPFYIEQFDAVTEMAMLRQATPSDGGTGTPGTSGEAQKSKTNGIDLGTRQGRRYPKGVNAPQFIHPSSEPLKASMEKQEQMKQEIRELVNLALTSVEGRRSGTSKAEDTKTLEAGLSYIGLELEYGEREIAKIWSEYESHTTAVTVAYPNNYSLKTDAERRTEAKELREELPNIPSMTYQKEMAKQIIDISMGHKVDSATLEKMKNEVETSEVVVTDPDIILKDHEAGFVSTELGSTLRGYPKGQVEQAKKDHAERLARIAAAQSDPQSRGVEDQSGDAAAGSDEKKKAGLTDKMDKVTDVTRGEGE